MVASKIRPKHIDQAIFPTNSDRPMQPTNLHTQVTLGTLKFLTIICVLLGLCRPCCSAQETAGSSPKRVALVVGNSDYEESALRNPANDADLISNALETVGFTVTKTKDRDKFQIEEDIDKVTEGLGSGDICLIFFAGHGMQVKGANYIVPVKAKIEREHHVKQRCVNVDYLLDALDGSGASLKMVIVDCCRDNPFRGFTRSKKSGLGIIDSAPDGSIVSFSTSNGTTASDGVGDNSPFTKHLAETLKSTRPEGLKVVDLFLIASRKTNQEMGQKPELRLDASMPSFYLRKPTQIKVVKNDMMSNDFTKVHSLLRDEKITGAQYDEWKKLKSDQSPTAKTQAKLNIYTRLANEEIDAAELTETLARVEKRDFSGKTAEEFGSSEVKKIPGMKLVPPRSWKNYRQQYANVIIDINLDKLRKANIRLQKIVASDLVANSIPEDLRDTAVKRFQLFADEVTKMTWVGILDPSGSSETPEYWYAKVQLKENSEIMQIMKDQAPYEPYFEFNDWKFYKQEDGSLIRIESDTQIWMGTPRALTTKTDGNFLVNKQVKSAYGSLKKGRTLGLSMDMSQLSPTPQMPQPPLYWSVSVSVDQGNMMDVEVGRFPASLGQLLANGFAQQDQRNMFVTTVVDQLKGNDAIDDTTKSTIRNLLSSLDVRYDGFNLKVSAPNYQIPILRASINHLIDQTK